MEIAYDRLSTLLEGNPTVQTSVELDEDLDVMEARQVVTMLQGRLKAAKQVLAKHHETGEWMRTRRQLYEQNPSGRRHGPASRKCKDAMRRPKQRGRPRILSVRRCEAARDEITEEGVARAKSGGGEREGDLRRHHEDDRQAMEQSEVVKRTVRRS